MTTADSFPCHRLICECGCKMNKSDEHSNTFWRWRSVKLTSNEIFRI